MIATALATACLALTTTTLVATPDDDLHGALVPDRWTSWTSDDGLPSDKVSAVLVDGSVVWAGTDQGLARLEQGTWTAFGPRQGLAHRVVTSLALSDATGDLWIGTLAGLSRYSAGRIDTFRQRDSGLINDVVYAVEVVDGRVWVATAAGVSVFDPRSATWQLFDHENTVMHEPWCYGLSRAPGAVWIAVWGGGVVEHTLEANSWRAYRDPDGEMELDLFRDDGLIHDVTSSVSFSDGVLWVGTYFGLSCYDGRSWRSWLEHDTPLPSNFINVVRADGKRCWIGTDSGLVLLDGERWSVFSSTADGGGQWLHTEPGNPVASGRTTGALADDYVLGLWVDERAIWVASAGGLSRGVWSLTPTPPSPSVDPDFPSPIPAAPASAPAATLPRESQ